MLRAFLGELPAALLRAGLDRHEAVSHRVRVLPRPGGRSVAQRLVHPLVVVDVDGVGDGFGRGKGQR